MNHRAIALATAAALGASLGACRDPEKERLKETTRPTYDKKTGKLTQLTFDRNKNGKIDTWTDMDGARPIQTRIDLNEDGKIDRWEYYGADGKLMKVGFSRKDNGKPDAWAFEGLDGKIVRVEISSTGDETKIDRWEHYDPARIGADGNTSNALAAAEEDTNGDGAPDKWETYENGVLKSVAFDENGDGKPDRRMTYHNGQLVLIESAPDAAGAITHRVAVK
jgi:antitoxin component YwqK of YwqJK toxin-antitoxin module